MGAAVSVLGYPSKTEAVVALRAQGLSTRQIAARVGIEVKSVSALEASAARPRQRIGDATVLRTTGFEIDPDIIRALRPFAAQRGMSAPQLARAILRAVVEDDIVGAVLDDADMIRSQ